MNMCEGMRFFVEPSMGMWCVIFPKGESMLEPNVLNYSRWRAYFYCNVVAEQSDKGMDYGDFYFWHMHRC